MRLRIYTSSETWCKKCLSSLQLPFTLYTFFA